MAAVDDRGVATGAHPGNASITAQNASLSASALLTVNPVPSLHSGRPFEWYQTQMGTGASANNNCGPTATFMAIRWYLGAAAAAPSVEELRSRHSNDGGWWTTDDVVESLGHYGIPFATHVVRSEPGNAIELALARGRILLLCVEMRWVTYDRQPFFGRFYAFGGGHFLIVKGRSADGHYLITYDSNSWAADRQADGTDMGRNRYYPTTELLDAATHWWPYALEIGAPSGSSTTAREGLPRGLAGPR